MVQEHRKLSVMKPSDAQWSPKDSLGPYTLERAIGYRDGNSVWAAQGPTGRVALKLILTSLAKKPEVRDQLVRQHAALQRLDHPLVVKALDIDVDGPQPYLAFEYVAGEPYDQSLKQRAQTEAYYSGMDLLELFSSAAQAVSHMHEQQIIHRNLTPQNFMLTTFRERPALKLLDFGLARILDDRAVDTTTLGRSTGVPLYMAPEQMLGQPATEASDVFALATLLFEMVTLRRTWAFGPSHQWLRAFVDRPATGAPNTWTQLVERITQGPRPQPSEIRPELPALLDQVIVKALAIDPKDRFSSVNDLMDALRPALLALPPPGESGDLPTRVSVPPDGFSASDWADTQATERFKTPAAPHDRPIEPKPSQTHSDHTEDLEEAHTPAGPLASTRPSDPMPDALPSPAVPAPKRNPATMPRLASVPPLFGESSPPPPTEAHPLTDMQEPDPTVRRVVPVLAIERHRVPISAPAAAPNPAEPPAPPAAPSPQTVPTSHHVITILLVVLAVLIGVLVTFMVAFWMGE